MADDDKGAKPATSSPVEPPSAIGAVKPGADSDPQTEWTASDRRGPLDSAGDEEVERFVPAHETDAEGGADPGTHETAGHAPVETLGATAAGEEATGIEPHSGERGHETAASAEDAAPATTRVATDPERKRSLVPVAAGVVVGALIGAGSAWLVYSQAGGGDGRNQQQVAALSSRVDALDKRPDPQPEVAKLQSGLADLQGKVATLNKQVMGTSKVAASATPTSNPQVQAPSAQPQTSGTPKPQQQQQQDASSGPAAKPADAGLAGKMAGLQAALDELKTRTAALQAQDGKEANAADKIKTLQSNLSDAQKQAAGAQKQAEGAQSALDAVKGEQKQLGDKLAGLTIAVAGALKKADGAEKQAAGAQSGLDTVQTQQKALEGKLGSPALAVVADSLVQQIDAGQPYTRQVDALAALNADSAKIAVLRENASHGVPSAQALLAQWKPLADPVIATGNTAPANANFGQKLEHGLFGLVSVRRADGTTGNDLTSRVNLIAADLGHDDVPGAYAVWQALPAGAKAKSDSWGALAKTSVEALAAARDLQHTAIDALGAKKS